MNIKETINLGKRVFEIEIESLIKSKNNIDENFAHAINLIKSAGCVIVTGVGKSGIIARKISATFSSIGKPSLFLHPVEALHGDIGIVENEDVVLLLSKSGSTEEIVTLVPFLRGRGAKLIALVGNTNSFLAHNSDVVLDCSITEEACPLNIAPTSSTTLALVMGDALAVTLMSILKIKTEDFARQHPLGQIGRNITLQVKDVMHTGNRMPSVKLKDSFREAIIEISNKQLGCVCIIDENNKLHGIITDGDIRRTLQSIDDLRGLSVQEVMTKNPLTIDQNSYLGEALTLMENRPSQIAVLPVVDENMICLGIIRIHDIIRSGL